MLSRRRWWPLLAALACSGARAADLASLADLSLEQLAEVVVSAVSRQPEPLESTAAAAYVISGDDIRRSGATTLGEALRLAPGLDVARADANQYAISARGFNNVLANKMLVLIDGRTVYTPLFSGVFWEAQDVLLDEVERIEVVTGPSTALWGSNAVNGLVHVITKPAAATQGTLVNLRAGNAERGADLRYGMALSDAAHLRLYAKQYHRRDTRRANGSAVGDAAEGGQVGFRADWSGTDRTLTFQGDAYQGAIDQPIGGARDFSGANLIGRWVQRFGPGTEATVQASLETTQREHPQVFKESLDTVDLVGQVGFSPTPQQQVLVGAGVREARDDVTNFASLAFLPASRSMTWTRVFAQDRIGLGRQVTLTLAGSVERNPYTGTEVLPSLRLAWQAQPQLMTWAALSRAVRAPSRIDREFYMPAQPPYQLAGGPSFDAEVANVAEVGARGQAGSRLSWSATLFHYDFKRLRSVGATAQGLQLQNGITGTTRGLESALQWRPADRWRVDANWTLLDTRLRLQPGYTDFGGLQALGNDPSHWGALRASFDLTPRHLWSVAVRHVGARPNPAVPSYTAVDTRLAWRLRPEAELSIVGQNLFDPGHAEWGPVANRVELERSLLVQWRWQY